jgi:hypothetical protein
MTDGNRRSVAAGKTGVEKAEGGDRKSSPSKKRRRARPEVLAARAEREASLLGVRAGRFAARADRARARATALAARAAKRGVASTVSDKGNVGRIPSMSTAKDIVDEAALEAGLNPEAEETPGYRESAPGAPKLSGAEVTALLYPAFEDTVVALGGAHWRLSPAERQAWLGLLATAYPDLDISRIAKPLFWIATLAIFGPRLAISVKQMVEIFKHGQSAGAAPVGQPSDLGQTGERKNDAGAGGGGVSPGGPMH